MKNKFGRLTIIKTFYKNKRIFSECICDCGNKKEIYKRSVTSGYTQSCGCLHSERSSKRMKKNNPMTNETYKNKMIKTLKKIGHKPPVQGGNGKSMPIPQKILLDALGIEWEAEYAVPTKLRKSGSYPTCYKIDIANSKLKIGIEVDGNSHGVIKRQEQDKKKTNFLISKGWIIKRYKNKEVITNLEKVIEDIYGIITTSERSNQ